jgi:hypothetical protein
MLNASLSIDGHPAPPGRLWLPEMSLSSARTGRRAATYALAIDAAGLLEVLRDPYADYVRQAKEDDAQTGSTDELGHAGYPPLEQLLASPSLLTDVLRFFIHPQEVLGPLLLAPPADVRGTWAVDTVNSARCEGGKVVIEGCCYRF